MKEKLRKYREAFDSLLPEINENIEKYRKGNFKIKILDKNGNPVCTSVKIEQKKHAFDFGTSALMIGDMGEKEKEYRDAVTNLFNLITTTFCWGVMETEPGKFRFDENSEKIYRRPPSDLVLNFAKENDMKVKGQPLFCGRWVPKWVPNDLDTLKKCWLKYIDEVAKRYDGKYNIFDVVNESYCTDGSWSNMSWLPIPIWNFVKWMLEEAGERFSENCVMERNETTHVNFGEFGEKYYRENKELIENGIRLDSIGFQFHFFAGQDCVGGHFTGDANLKSIYNTYHKMSTLGVPMYITEITIPSAYKNLTKEQGEELQAEILDKLYRLWFSIPNMQGIIYWNLKDGDTWENESECLGCLLDEYMRKKKSYYTLEHLIKREWNTCITSKTDESGVLEFSGFYGDYDISFETEDTGRTKYSKSFVKNEDSLTVII